MKKTDLDVIRVETALSRFPLHRLAKTGAVEIIIREQNDAGDLLRWKVSHNSEYGQPGPLAYKLDTLVINRRIEAAGKPIPKLIKLGSLHDICRELGLSEGQNKIHVKKALYQNAFAAITAKIRYKAADGTKRSIEFGTTRYAVVMTGETLPDGRRADAVYVILHDPYRDVLNTALTRPLDYDYLRTLAPAPQRLYELLSYQIYAALKNGNPTARLTYSEFCLYAPQTRYFTYDQVKKQSYKIHAPHRQSGYIARVEFEATTDRDGRPDWTLIYTPGPKAKAEYQAFTKKGGPVVLEVEPVKAEPEPEPTGLERELIDRGVMRGVVAELVRDFPEELIRAKVEQVDWLREKRPKKVTDVGAYLAEAIRKDYAAPAGFEGRAERAERETTEREREDRARRAKARRREEQARIDAYWEGLTPEQQARLDTEALEQADPETRASYEHGPPALRQLARRVLCEDYIRTLLALSTATVG
jgi:hypothetical protein